MQCTFCTLSVQHNRTENNFQPVLPCCGSLQADLHNEIFQNMREGGAMVTSQADDIYSSPSKSNRISPGRYPERCEALSGLSLGDILRY